jgi:hypothetical protein
MGWWAKSLQNFNAIRPHGTQSIRQRAERTGRSKSRVPRHPQAMTRRDRQSRLRWNDTSFVVL